MHELFVQGVSSHDLPRISEAVDKLHAAMRELPKSKLLVAAQLRLQQWEHEKQYLNLNVEEEEAQARTMYSTLISRALQLDDGISGVLPMFDMLNHSLEPNLSLSLDGECFELFCVRDIEPGEELFLCYTDIDEPWDEDAAVWTLVQWGIPIPQHVWDETTTRRQFVNSKSEAASWDRVE